MHNKFDFGSILIVFIFVIIILLIVYFAGINISNSWVNKTTEDVWYSKPTWSDPTPKPTPKPTEITEETKESEEDLDNLEE